MHTRTAALAGALLLLGGGPLAAQIPGYAYDVAVEAATSNWVNYAQFVLDDASFSQLESATHASFQAGYQQAAAQGGDSGAWREAGNARATAENRAAWVAALRAVVQTPVGQRRAISASGIVEVSVVGDVIDVVYPGGNFLNGGRPAEESADRAALGDELFMGIAEAAATYGSQVMAGELARRVADGIDAGRDPERQALYDAEDAGEAAAAAWARQEFARARQWVLAHGGSTAGFVIGATQAAPVVQAEAQAEAPPPADPVDPAADVPDPAPAGNTNLDQLCDLYVESDEIQGHEEVLLADCRERYRRNDPVWPPHCVCLAGPSPELAGPVLGYDDVIGEVPDQDESVLPGEDSILGMPGPIEMVPVPEVAGVYDEYPPAPGYEPPPATHCTPADQATLAQAAALWGFYQRLGEAAAEDYLDAQGGQGGAGGEPRTLRLGDYGESMGYVAYYVRDVLCGASIECEGELPIWNGPAGLAGFLTRSNGLEGRFVYPDTPVTVPAQICVREGVVTDACAPVD